MFDGGGFEVTRLGPKDAVIEYREVPPCRHAYFREAFRGANYGGLCLFSTSAYVNELPKRRSALGMALRCSWV
jgi:hypothetical protein